VADPSGYRTGLVIADLVIAVGLSAAAGPDPVVAVAVVVAAGFGFVAASASDSVYSVCLVCTVAGAREKGKAAAVSYFLALRSSSLHNRNFPSHPCFADRV